MIENQKVHELLIPNVKGKVSSKRSRTSDLHKFEPLLFACSHVTFKYANNLLNFFIAKGQYTF